MSRQHWELDPTGQPTGRLIDRRRRAEFITPIPKPKKRRGTRQQELDLDEGQGLSTKSQAYDLTSIINEVRQQVDTWRNLPASQWQVTPETARLLQHWRHHEYGGLRPFFCQVEAVETAIWFTEVAPHSDGRCPCTETPRPRTATTPAAVRFMCASSVLSCEVYSLCGS